MKCELVGKLVNFTVSGEGENRIRLTLAGRDQHGKVISGELTIDCQPALLRGVKLHDLLTITVKEQEG